MNDPLVSLLRQTDARSGAPMHDSALLLAGVQRRYRRRQQLRGSLAVVGMALCVGLLGWLTLGRGSVGTVPQPWAPQSSVAKMTRPVAPEQSAVELAKLRREIAELDAQARQLQDVARQIVAARKQDALAQTDRGRSVLESLPEAYLAEKLDVAARLGVYRADVMKTEFGQTDEAEAGYRAVVQRFPNTAGAATAQQRLEQLATMN